MAIVMIQDINNSYEFREEAIIGLRDVDWTGPPYSFSIFTTGGKVDLIYDNKDRATTAHHQISRIIGANKK